MPLRALVIDCAGPVVGVAGFADGRCVGVYDARIAAGADGWLTPHVASLLGRLGELDRVGVTVGPGAFTGVRVGVASALGLARARGVDGVAVSSLALRACLVSGEARVLAVLDARKGKVYAGLFDTRGAVPVALGPERDVAPEVAFDTDPAVVVGEGAVAYADAVARAGHRPTVDPARSPVAAAWPLLEAGEPVPVELVSLRYLREPDARPPVV
ncbi:MAG: tRNA (adenosine(37)-N6)-threonylcarbamoyltransferase complex dimerization subunit type 1 TsaB [Myxococcota bacterium]